MEFFGDEDLIFMKFFRGRVIIFFSGVDRAILIRGTPLFFRGRNHIVWKSTSGVNAFFFFLIFRVKSKNMCSTVGGEGTVIKHKSQLLKEISSFSQKNPALHHFFSKKTIELPPYEV